MQQAGTNNSAMDVDYARSVIEHASKLDRVQKMRALLPPELAKVLSLESNEFLFGVTTLVQAIHDLIGNQLLDDAAKILQEDEENIAALRLAKGLVGTFGLLEAMGLISCEQIVQRHDNPS